MSDKIKQLLEDVKNLNEDTPHIITSVADVKKQTIKQRKTDVATEQDINGKDNGFINILKEEFVQAPFLSVAETYVKKLNSKTRSIGNCMSEFKNENKLVFVLLFVFDVVIKAIYLLVILFFVLRGLGLIDYFFSTCKK